MLETDGTGIGRIEGIKGIKDIEGEHSKAKKSRRPYAGYLRPAKAHTRQDDDGQT